ncbi:MAG: hypothetical protein ACTIJJ_04495 [Galactobacter sp.]
MQNRLRPLGHAWAASGVAVALAVLTHVLAGGHTPNPVLVAVTWALGAVVALPFATRKPSGARLAGLLLPAQLIYHLAFGGTHVGSHHTTGHLHGAELTAALSPTTHGGAGNEMLLAHLASALLSVAAIRYAERSLDVVRELANHLADVVCRLARAARMPLVPATRRRAWVANRTPAVLTAVALPGPVSRRGPPVFLTAHA